MPTRKIRPEVSARRIARAVRVVDIGIRYKLGRGGNKPGNVRPDDMGLCDCSGFIAWVLEVSRKPKVTRLWWIETTNIWRDATTKQKVFVALSRPEPGCIIVYPDLGGRQGHVALVSDVDSFGGIEIIDCSSTKDGIFIRSGNWMKAKPGVVFATLKQDITSP